MWIIRHIFDGEYGCEERTGETEKGTMLSLTLVNELGAEKYVPAEESFLSEHGLEVGSEWPEE